MKKIIIFFVYLLLSAAVIRAEEGIDPSGSEDNLKPGTTNAEVSVPDQVPEQILSQAGKDEALDKKPFKKMPPKLPPGVSPESITPDNIRKFLAKPKVAKPKEESYIILNFDNAELKDVINTVGTITNENFILSPGIDARITIHSAKKIPVSQVMNIFEAVLEVNGMSLVRSGEFFKIVSAATAKQKPTSIKKGRSLDEISDVDRQITQIIPVEYVPVNEIGTILKPLLSQTGSVITDSRNNLLIVNDYSSSIRRLVAVLNEIDVDAFSNTRMIFFQPKYSDVITLSNELTEVLDALNLTREGIALVPIDRINSLVIFSSSQSLLKIVQGWMVKLDEEVKTGQTIFVYPVQNVKAEQIADILNTLYVTDEGAQTTRTTRRTQTQKGKKGATAAQRTARRTSTQKTSGSRVEIITFEPTNSLVILAPPGIYRDMVQTIKRIDIYPREVLIQAIVAEVQLGDGLQYGIQWSLLDKISDSGGDYQTLLQNRASSAPSLPALLAPSLAENLGAGPSSGLSYVVFKPEKLLALIHALATEAEVNILSSPRLLVRDQEEANIEVGSDIPTATSTTQSTTADTLTQNIEYRKTGVLLKIKPTINEERTVVLDVEQEVSALGENLQVGQEGNTFPSFDTTKTKTSIIVPDNQTIIIGGIIQEELRDAYQGIPVLSKIPILGHLFRYTVKNKAKKELVIMITPRVVANQAEADKLTLDYMDKLRELKDYLRDSAARLDIPNIEVSDTSQSNEP
jgi:general secretion pathway protein D